MERTPEHHPRPLSEQLLRVLPEPRSADSELLDYLITATGALYLDAVAGSRGIESITARTIAYNFAALMPDGHPFTALDHFARTGHGTHADISAEYLPLYHHPELNGQGRMTLDVLGTHLLNREHAGEPSPKQPAEPLTGHLLRFSEGPTGEEHMISFQTPEGTNSSFECALHFELAQLTAERGDAFAAYLRLPGLDATAPDIETDFERALLDEETARHLLEAPATELGRLWEVVETGGTSYAFCR